MHHNSQSVSNNEYIETQYEKVYGNLPQNYNEVVIVLDDKSSLTDLLLTQMGYYSQDQFFELIYQAMSKLPENKDITLTPSLYKTKFSIEELVNKEFTWYSNDVIFERGHKTNDNTTNVNPIPYTYNHIKKNSWDTLEEGKDKIDLKIVGIYKPKENRVHIHFMFATYYEFFSFRPSNN